MRARKRRVTLLRNGHLRARVLGYAEVAGAGEGNSTAFAHSHAHSRTSKQKPGSAMSTVPGLAKQVAF